MKLLIVDDFPINLKLLRAQLEAEGHEVFEARDGQEALAFLSQQPVDGVISDILMPRMDGYRFCLEIRRSPELYAVPFIFYTSTYTSPGDEKVALDLGADAFLKKPSSINDIVKAIECAARKGSFKRSKATDSTQDLDLMEEYSQRLVDKLEKKNVELEQRTSELQLVNEKLRHLLAHSPVIIYGLNLKTSEIIPHLGSENVTVLLGYTVEESLKKDWWPGNVHPEDRRRTETALTEAVTAGRSTVEYRIRHKDGTYRWVEDNQRLVRDAEGNPSEIVGVWIDITERKRTESELIASEERFRQMADTIDEVFWMTDPQKQQMLYVSPAYEIIWGRSCDSLYRNALTWVESIHQGDRERILNSARTNQSSGRYNETYRIVRPDGTARWIHDRAFPIRNAAGEVYRICGVAADITQRRDLEEQFRQAQKMEAIGQLAGGVAHDFNNILTIIEGHAQLLMSDERFDADSREQMGEIFSAAERASGLTRQLLTFSRKQVMQPRILDLNEVVAGVTKMLTRVIGEDVSLQVEYSQGEREIEADATMMEQILLNLAVNARDAMPNGGRLIIKTSVEKNPHTVAGAETGEFICLSMRDTGSGMSPEIKARVFEPFFTTKGPGKGTGLGLATVYGIVQQHQGWIEINSEPGKGTEFQIFLPVSAHVKNAPELKPVKPKLQGGTETILLVEDEPALRQLVRIILSRSGYCVLEASSGVAALALCKDHITEIDLLLTDLVMPEGVSGIQLAQRISEIKPNLKTIFTSGYSADFTECNFGMKDGLNFLAKPYEPQKLLKTIRECLDQPAL